MSSVNSAVLLQGRRLLLLGTLIVLGTLFFARPGVSQTAWDAYVECSDKAAVAANNCYMNADGYWENRKCDLQWDINQLACARALLRTLGF